MIRSQNVITSTTWANKPSAYITGQPVFISNAGTKGSHWFYDGTRWKPVGGSCVLATLDSASSAINNSITIAFQYQMPAGLLQTGDRLRVALSITKSGTTDAGGVRGYCGTAGTTGDTGLFSLTAMAAATLQQSYLLDFRLESATSLQMLASSNAPMGYGQASTVALASPVSISSASANALYFSIGLNSGGTTNTLQAVDAQLTLIAKAN